MFGFFYYSKGQDDVISSTREHKTYARQLITGKEVLYTEWVIRFPFLPGGNWSDYKLVAIGTYSRSEKNSFNKSANR